MQPLTVAIIARNAQATIGRALRSVIASGTNWPILLVDDSDNDETASIAKQVAGDQVTIVVPEFHVGTGNARQTALENITTPYGVWLDADDELLPGRLVAMLKVFEEDDVDLVYDGAKLYDQKTDAFLKDLNIPDFMFEKGAEGWLLERNWLPVLFGGFNTTFAKGVGYDRDFFACEDYDFLLRATVKGGRMIMLPSFGVKYYFEEGSLSRDSAKTKKFTSAIYNKHQAQEINNRLNLLGFSEAGQSWVNASRALYMGDIAGLFESAHHLINSDEVSPPYGRNSSWLGHYVTATALMLQSRWQEALDHLKQIKDILPIGCDVQNNRGVCLYNLGDAYQAEIVLADAIRLKPGYLDAQNNLDALRNQTQLLSSFTHHPMRVWDSHDIYNSAS